MSVHIGDLDLVGHGEDGLADRKAEFVEVDVLPTDPEDLPTAHPGVGPEVNRGEQAVIAGAVEELTELRGGPNLHLALRCRGRLGRVSEVGDVALHAAFPVGVGEGLAQDGVDVPDGLDRVAAAVAVELPVDEKLGVELVEVLGGEALQGDLADARDGVNSRRCAGRSRMSTVAAGPAWSGATGR